MRRPPEHGGGDPPDDLRAGTVRPEQREQARAHGRDGHDLRPEPADGALGVRVDHVLAARSRPSRTAAAEGIVDVDDHHHPGLHRQAGHREQTHPDRRGERVPSQCSVHTLPTSANGTEASTMQRLGQVPELQEEQRHHRQRHQRATIHSRRRSPAISSWYCAVQSMRSSGGAESSPAARARSSDRRARSTYAGQVDPGLEVDVGRSRRARAPRSGASPGPTGTGDGRAARAAPAASLRRSADRTVASRSRSGGPAPAASSSRRTGMRAAASAERGRARPRRRAGRPSRATSAGSTPLARQRLGIEHEAGPHLSPERLEDRAPVARNA